MKRSDIRGSISRAKINEESINTIYGEIVIIAVLAGIGTQSWLVFGALLMGLGIGIHFRVFAIVFCIFFTLCWGVIGYAVGTLFSSLSASIVLAVIGILAGFGTHMSALEYIDDQKEA